MAETSQQSRTSPEVQEIDDTNMDMDIDDNADDKSADGQERTIDLPTNKRVESFMLQSRQELIEASFFTVTSLSKSRSTSSTRWIILCRQACWSILTLDPKRGCE